MIHFCFRTEVNPRNQHTLLPKLALVDTVQTPAARVQNKSKRLCELRFTLVSEPRFIHGISTRQCRSQRQWTPFRLRRQECEMKKGEIFQVRKKMGLRIFLQDRNDFAAKTEFEIVLEYFCRIGVILRLRQNVELSQNIFEKLELDLEYFCPRRGEKRNLDLENLLSKKAKGRREVGLRIICPSKKGEGE